MANKDQLGVGIIGSGSIARVAHIKAINELDNVQLVCTMDVNEKTARLAAEMGGAKYWYTDYHKVLERDDVDLVIIASPNCFHYEQTLAAAKAGKHVICEKPLAVTNGQAWEMVEACKKAGVHLMVGVNQRFWPQNAIGKELIDQGYLGKVREITAALHEDFDLYDGGVADTHFRRSPELAAAAALFDVGPHKVDLVCWLMGREVKRVVGIATRLATPEEKSPLDDCVALIMQFEDGSLSTVDVDRYSPVVSNQTCIYGDLGTMYLSTEAHNPFQAVPLAIYLHQDMEWDELPQILKDYRYPELFWPDDLIQKPMRKKWVSVCPPREWSYTRMLRDFFGAIVKGEEPCVKPEDGAKVMDILCGVFKSMETGAWVDLPLKEDVVPPFYRPYYENPSNYYS